MSLYIQSRTWLGGLYADVVADGGDGGSFGERGVHGAGGGGRGRGAGLRAGPGRAPPRAPSRRLVEHFPVLSVGRRGPPSVYHVLYLHVQHAREQEPEYWDHRHPHPHRGQDDQVVPYVIRELSYATLE